MNALDLYRQLPVQAQPFAAALTLGAALEGARAILPIPNRWAANRIVSAYGDRPNVTPAFALALVEAAERLRIDPFALANLIHFESGFRASATNPRSGATGLIQFMPSTAAGLGTSAQALRSMSATQQIPWVEAYLRQQKAAHGSLRRPVDLMLSVFYPAYIGRWTWRPFPGWVQRANPGILTPWHYDRLVRSRSRLPMQAAFL